MPHVDIRKTPSSDGRFHASRGILLTQALRLTVRIVTTAGLARLVSPSDYGVYGMAAFVHGLAYVVQDFGLATFTLRKPELAPTERTALFWLNLGTGAILALVVAALGPIAAAFFREATLAWLLPVLAVTLFLNGLHAQLRAQLGREGRFGELNRIEVLAFVVSSGAALVAAAWGAGFWALAVLPITAELVIATGIWRAQSWRPGAWPRGFSPRAALGFGVGISGHEMLRYLQRNADQFFVGRWFGPGALGLYGRGGQLVVLPGQYVCDPLASWVITTLSRDAHDPATARLFLRRVLNGLTHLVLPLAVVLFCLPAEILRTAFGPAWVGGAGMLRGLSIALVAQPLLVAETWVLLAGGHSRRLVAWSGCTLLAVILACVLSLSSGPVALSAAVSGAMVFSAVGGTAFALAGLPIGARDIFTAVVRPMAGALFAVVATSGVLALIPAAHVFARLATGVACTAAAWALACTWPDFRRDLTQHFLRNRA